MYDLATLKNHIDRDELARRPAGVWRYHEFLPVADPALRIDIGAGGTRLTRMTRLPESQIAQKLFMKIEGSNPTGSFKDRPIGVAASVALEHGARGLACLTSGNIGSAMAAIAAKAGIPALVFLLGSAGGAAQKSSINIEKYVQISAYGARVITPLGDLGQLQALADRVEKELGWSFMHTMQGYQPDGDKTTAFEICEQLNWQAPAAVFVPTGTGTNLFGLWQGFSIFKANLQRYASLTVSSSSFAYINTIEEERRCSVPGERSSLDFQSQFALTFFSAFDHLTRVSGQ